MMQSIQHAGAEFASRCRNGAVRDHATTLAILLGSAALAFMPMLFLLWLMQPKVLANPGTTVRTMPRVVYAEPPPADLDLLQAAETPDVPAPLRQHEAQLRQAPSAEHHARAHERTARVRTRKAQAARTPGTRIDPRAVATQQMRSREMPRNARPSQRAAEKGLHQGNQNDVAGLDRSAARLFF